MTTPVSSLDNLPIRASQYGLVALVMMCLTLDGLDVQLLSLVTPLLLHEWAISRAQIAPALAAALIGMAFGSALGGILGDRWGRKSILVASTGLFGAMTFAASFSHGVAMLSALRLLSGVGFGAAGPNGFALATEWLPQRVRARVTAVLAMGGPFGAFVASGIGIVLIPQLGWRGCFLACGAAICVIALWMSVQLPESFTFLFRQGRSRQAAAAIRKLLRVDPKDLLEGVAQRAKLADASADTSARLFTRANLRMNVSAPLAYFCTAFVSFAMVGWLPTILTMSGLSIHQALQGSLCFNGLGLAGGLASPLLIERIGSRNFILTCCLVSFAALTAMAALLSHGAAVTNPADLIPLMVAIGVAGCISGATTTGAISIAVFAYPAACRAGGVGFTLMGGRAGGILSLLAGGLLLNMRGNDATPIFIAFGIALFAAAATTMTIDRHVPPGRMAVDTNSPEL